MSKVETSLVEHAGDNPPDQASAGYETDLEHLGYRYFFTAHFLGSFLAMGLSMMGGLCAFSLVAPILNVINADIGPSPSYVWISYVYNTSLAVFLAIFGRLSDIFGRRYFFIGGTVLAIIGNIVCMTASRIDVLIGGNVLMGIASSAQISYCYVLGELVPVRYRYLATSVLYLFALPSVFGPAIAYSFLELNPQQGWRYCYYLLIGINVVSLVLWVAFYFPPNFHMKHGQESRRQWTRQFDYVGTLLFAGGLVVFLLGISCGGTVYPWRSAGAVGMIVIGFLALVAFVLWETYATLKAPLLPLHLFQRLDWVATIIAVGFAASIYYAASMIWPQQVQVLYDLPSLTQVGFLSSLPGVGQMAGEIVGGLVAVPLGRHRYQLVVLFLLSGVFLGCCATLNITNRASPAALITLANFCLGWVEMIGMANSTILIADQREIGIAGGIGGSVRSMISAIASVIYVTVLNNRLGDMIPFRVPAALVEAGLPRSSIPDFLSLLQSGDTDGLITVHGSTPAIVRAGRTAYRWASADSYRTVFLSTIAFSAVAVVTAFFTPNTERLMTGQVATTLHWTGERAGAEKEEVYQEADPQAENPAVAAATTPKPPFSIWGDIEKAAPAIVI